MRSVHQKRGSLPDARIEIPPLLLLVTNDQDRFFPCVRQETSGFPVGLALGHYKLLNCYNLMLRLISSRRVGTPSCITTRTSPKSSLRIISMSRASFSVSIICLVSLSKMSYLLIILPTASTGSMPGTFHRYTPTRFRPCRCVYQKPNQV